MAILLFFSLLSGIATVLSPCVIPILPALLSASTGRGPYRPWGIILGLTLSFSFFTLFLTAIIHFTHIPVDFLRYVAIILIGLFGLMMVFPRLGDWFAQVTSSFANFGQAIQAKSATVTSGFWSGFVLGMALGIVWTPCAGPILAAITTLVATSAVTWQAVALTLAYSLGAAIPMFLIIYGGNRSFYSVRFFSQHAEAIRKIFGVLMVLTAMAIALHWDIMFQQVAIQYIPFINIEDNPEVQRELAKLRPTGQTAFAKRLEETAQEKSTISPFLPKIAPAPDLVGITEWINSKPLTLGQLRGKVVLIDFWTYSCINCIRTFPYLTRWNKEYKDKGLVIIGIHTPEFAFEKKLSNVEEATQRFNITYPVALDNDYKTWQNYSNHYWPAHYLIDQQGVVRDFHFGEGAYIETENAIRNLLGMKPLEGKEKPSPSRPMTPEIYLGFGRADRYQLGLSLQPYEVISYHYLPPLQNDRVGLKGKWRIEQEKIISEGQESQLDLNFLATRVYLVMDAETSQTVTVLLDDAPLPKDYYTADMNEQGQIMVKEPRKYDAINLKMRYGRHKLTLIFPKGVSAYAFTFGDEL